MQVAERLGYQVWSEQRNYSKTPGHKVAKDVTEDEGLQEMIRHCGQPEPLPSVQELLKDPELTGRKSSKQEASEPNAWHDMMDVAESTAIRRSNAQQRPDHRSEGPGMPLWSAMECPGPWTGDRAELLNHLDSAHHAVEGSAHWTANRAHENQRAGIAMSGDAACGALDYETARARFTASGRSQDGGAASTQQSHGGSWATRGDALASRRSDASSVRRAREGNRGQVGWADFPFCDAKEQGSGMRCCDGGVMWSGAAEGYGDHGMKMRLDLREVDAWGFGDRQQGRVQLSEGELAQLLADSADSSDSL
jgi:hypothetical protein